MKFKTEPFRSAWIFFQKMLILASLMMWQTVHRYIDCLLRVNLKSLFFFFLSFFPWRKCIQKKKTWRGWWCFPNWITSKEEQDWRTWKITSAFYFFFHFFYHFFFLATEFCLRSSTKATDLSTAQHSKWKNFPKTVHSISIYWTWV